MLCQYSRVGEGDEYGPFRVANSKLAFQGTNDILGLLSLTSGQQLRYYGNFLVLRLTEDQLLVE